MKKRKKQKKLYMMFGLLICAAILLGGSFAWTDFTQSRTNKFRGNADPDATLHDEFDGEENKDVFVENSGTKNIYVRVRLDEYMEISGESFVAGVSAREKQKWQPHEYPQSGGDINNCGAINDGVTAHLFHRYYTWQITGASRGYYPGTPGMTYTRLKADGTVDTDGDGINETAPAMAPITMKQYTDLKAKDEVDLTNEEKALIRDIEESGCWILDSDGWAYWSKVLEPNTATNLLLDKVENILLPEDDWYYGIDVKLQAVTANDFTKWEENGNEVTQSAKKLIAFWNEVMSS